ARTHAEMLYVVRGYADAPLAPRLNGEDLLDALIARRNFLEPLESLHVRLERFASRPRPRSRDAVRGLNEHGHLALVRHVVVVRGDAVDHERVLAVLRGNLDSELHVRALVLW